MKTQLTVDGLEKANETLYQLAKMYADQGQDDKARALLAACEIVSEQIEAEDAE